MVKIGCTINKTVLRKACSLKVLIFSKWPKKRLGCVLYHQVAKDFSLLSQRAFIYNHHRQKKVHLYLCGLCFYFSSHFFLVIGRTGRFTDYDSRTRWKGCGAKLSAGWAGKGTTESYRAAERNRNLEGTGDIRATKTGGCVCIVVDRCWLYAAFHNRINNLFTVKLQVDHIFSDFPMYSVFRFQVMFIFWSVILGRMLLFFWFFFSVFHTYSSISFLHFSKQSSFFFLFQILFSYNEDNLQLQKKKKSKYFFFQ